MKASDLFVKALEAEGVEYVFGIPGEENLDLLESTRHSRIKLVLTRHEQAAAAVVRARPNSIEQLRLMRHVQETGRDLLREELREQGREVEMLPVPDAEAPDAPPAPAMAPV